MSTDVTMQELEFETAELLPARETLGKWDCGGSRGSSGFSFSQTAYSGGNGHGNGNGDWGLLAGNGNGIANGSAININVLSS